MAKANEVPVQDVYAGAAAFDEDLPRVLAVLEQPSLAALGWSCPNKLTLLVPLSAARNGVTNEYLLRLSFQAYRVWPPSAQFVNPATLSYVYPQDQHFIPQLTSPECHTHPGYQRNAEAPRRQLICCSATLEFYEVLHDVKPEYVWSGTETFLTTIVAIQRAMVGFYQGPFPVHEQ